MPCSICHQNGHNCRTCPQRNRRGNPNPNPAQPRRRGSGTPDQRPNPNPAQPRQRRPRNPNPDRGRVIPRQLFEPPTIPQLKEYYTRHQSLPPFHQYVSQDIEYMKSCLRIFDILMIQLENRECPEIPHQSELSSLLFCYTASLQEVIDREVQIQEASYTTPIFQNHTGRHVSIYWYRTRDPNELMLCCYVDPQSNIYSPQVKDYALGTHLIVKWDDESGEPHHQRSRITSSNQIIHISQNSDMNQWKNGAIKMSYLLSELIRMGANNEVKYPNLAPIIDLVQDIKLPEVSEHDKEVAGVPSVFTNMT